MVDPLDRARFCTVAFEPGSSDRDAAIDRPPHHERAKCTDLFVGEVSTTQLRRRGRERNGEHGAVPTRYLVGAGRRLRDFETVRQRVLHEVELGRAPRVARRPQFDLWNCGGAVSDAFEANRSDIGRNASRGREYMPARPNARQIDRRETQIEISAAPDIDDEWRGSVDLDGRKLLVLPESNLEGACERHVTVSDALIEQEPRLRCRHAAGSQPHELRWLFTLASTARRNSTDDKQDYKPCSHYTPPLDRIPTLGW